MKIFFPIILSFAVFADPSAHAADRAAARTAATADRQNRELELLFAPQPSRALEVDTGLLAGAISDSRPADALLSDFGELISFGNDLVARYRKGQRVSETGVLYMKHSGLMFSRNGEKFSYGVLTVEHSTGPALRWRW